MGDEEVPPLTRRKFRLAGFADAWRGVRLLLGTQPNARVHLGATVVLVLLGALFGISRLEWIAVLSAASVVWVTEAVNTAIEYAVDLVSPEWNRLAGLAKDAAAGAVLLAAAFAVLIGLLVFGPRLIALAR